MILESGIVSVLFEYSSWREYASSCRFSSYGCICLGLDSYLKLYSEDYAIVGCEKEHPNIRLETDGYRELYEFDLRNLPINIKSLLVLVKKYIEDEYCSDLKIDVLCGDCCESYEYAHTKELTCSSYRKVLHVIKNEDDKWVVQKCDEIIDSCQLEIYIDDKR